MSSNLSARTKGFGDEREMESGLTFNQLICEFESRHPRHVISDLPIADCQFGPFHDKD
jgi:hypothetical protein